MITIHFTVKIFNYKQFLIQIIYIKLIFKNINEFNVYPEYGSQNLVITISKNTSIFFTIKYVKVKF